jgi:hypothetical protein
MLLITFYLQLLFSFSPINTAIAEDLTYEDIVKIIKDKKIKSVEKLIPLLPESYRTKNTFLYKSGSLQDADITNPRAIVFGDSATLILSFNGDSHQKGFNQLEIMQWRPEKRALELRLIQFPPQGKGDVDYSKPNPTRCTKCHGEDPNWKWDEVYKWKGAYGSDGDMLPDKNHYQETLDFLSFKKNAQSNEHYKHLFKKSENPVFPYATSGNELNKEKNPDPYHQYSKHTQMPNAGLSVQIAAMAAVRASRLIQKSPLFAQIQYTLLYSLLGCQYETHGS